MFGLIHMLKPTADLIVENKFLWEQEKAHIWTQVWEIGDSFILNSSQDFWFTTSSNIFTIFAFTSLCFIPFHWKYNQVYNATQLSIKNTI